MLFSKFIFLVAAAAGSVLIKRDDHHDHPTEEIELKPENTELNKELQVHLGEYKTYSIV